MNKFGENLLWLLHDVSVTLNDISDTVDGTEVDIYGEDEFGREAMTTVYVPDLLMSANSEINRVDSENMALREALMSLCSRLNEDGVNTDGIGKELLNAQKLLNGDQDNEI